MKQFSSGVTAKSVKTSALTPALSPGERVSLGASLDHFSDLRRRLRFCVIGRERHDPLAYGMTQNTANDSPSPGESSPAGYCTKANSHKIQPKNEKTK